MASSSLPLSVIDDSPNNPNCSSINMAQDTDEYVLDAKPCSSHFRLRNRSLGTVQSCAQCETLALRDSDGATALFNAARAGNIKAVKFSPGIELLRRALMVGFHDVALHLVERYSDLATCHFDSPPTEDFAPLTVLAKRPWAFRSGSRFNLCNS
ncbi:hypothetical protein CK203_107958 [Vitis vinifera]|uniref:Uncharacterized protein n=1 Tax=Vitis vinifera TaxID=29760 RepID=A0A438BQZ8_VITVI|nr:hypothetical protein CK203_107958 [Vitis vinifera]